MTTATRIAVARALLDLWHGDYEHVDRDAEELIGLLRREGYVLVKVAA